MEFYVDLLTVSVLIFAAILGVLEIGKRVCQTYMK